MFGVDIGGGGQTLRRRWWGCTVILAEIRETVGGGIDVGGGSAPLRGYSRGRVDYTVMLMVMVLVMIKDGAGLNGCLRL
jgi:hypothetical protein